MSLTAAKLIESVSKTDELLNYMDERTAEGGVDMCQALQEMITDAREQGIECGIERGRKQKAEEILKKLRELGLDEETIRKVAE